MPYPSSLILFSRPVILESGSSPDNFLPSFSVSLSICATAIMAGTNKMTSHAILSASGNVDSTCIADCKKGPNSRKQTTSNAPTKTHRKMIGSRQTKTREMAKDYLARAGRRQNIRLGAFIHSGCKRPNPFTAPPDQSRRSTLPPHAIPRPTGRVETAPRVILLRPSGTPQDTVEGGTNSGGIRSRNHSSGSNLVERSSPFGTPSGTVRVEPDQMKPFQ